jgi:apolipoprotein N-acyltransferase
MERTRMWPAVFLFAFAAALGVLAFATESLRWLTVIALLVLVAGGGAFYRSLQQT